MRRGGDRFDLPVSAPFVWRCPGSLAVAPFPHPAHRTGRAGLPHPAPGQDITRSPTEGHGFFSADSPARAGWLEERNPAFGKVKSSNQKLDHQRNQFVVLACIECWVSFVNPACESKRSPNPVLVPPSLPSECAGLHGFAARCLAAAPGFAVEAANSGLGMTDGSGEACCSDNPVQSLDKLAPDEVSAPKSCGLHAFSADIAPKSCRHLVPNHFVEARNLLVEAFCSGVEAFCCDDLVRTSMRRLGTTFSGFERPAAG